MTSITRYDPFNELVDDLFKGFFVRPLAFEPRAELPRVKKEDIHVTIDGAQVTLAAEVKREKEATENDRLLHTERTFGKVTRSFTLPQELDEAKVEATFRDGVLELALPKKAAA